MLQTALPGTVRFFFPPAIRLAVPKFTFGPIRLVHEDFQDNIYASRFSPPPLRAVGFIKQTRDGRS